MHDGPLKVLILGPYFYPQQFGIEKVMYQHAKGLAALGHDVHVASSRLRFPFGSLRSLAGEEQREGFTIHRISVVLRSPPPRRIFQYQSNGGFIMCGLGALIRRLDPDVVHAHNIGASAWAWHGARYASRHGKAFFYSPHYHVRKFKDQRRWPWLRTFFEKTLNRLPVRSADAIFHLTPYEHASFYQEYPQCPPNRYVTLPNGIGPPLAKPAQRESGVTRLLFVGRVDDPRKGFAILLEAMGRIWRQSDGESIRLEVVGSIADGTREKIAADFRGRVLIHGEVAETELDAAYARADIFVMPSLYEGFGMPYLEAMRYGVPVIGSRVGGVPWVVPIGTGILVAPGSVDELYCALNHLIRNPKLRESIGKEARRWSSGFHWDAIVARLETCYREAVGGRASADSEQTPTPPVNLLKTVDG
jgi:glycosyltransferase involved in cell wall biosynthesis